MSRRHLRAFRQTAAVVLLLSTVVFLHVARGFDLTQTPQVAPRSTATVSGTVMSDERDGQPVRRALVAMKRADDGTTRAAVTDDAGRFTVLGLRSGRYLMLVTKDGWVTSVYGATKSWRPPGVAIAVADGQSFENIHVRMMRGAVIAGHLRDAYGNPLVSLQPQLMEVRTVGGQKQLQPINAMRQGRLMETDARGEFRFYGLPPGTYLLEAAITITAGGTGLFSWGATGPMVSPPEAPRRFVPTYYPGATDAADAVPLVVGPGEQRLDVDFVVRAEHVARIEGRVIGPSATSINGRVTILAERISVDGLKGPLDWAGRSVTSSDATGTFTLNALAPGRYKVTAQASSQPPPAPTPGSTAGRGSAPALGIRDLWAETEVAISGHDATGVALTLRLGQTVSGRVTVDTAGQPPTPLPWLYLWNWADEPNISTGSPAAVLRPDPAGSFTTAGVRPGRYAVMIALTPTPATPERWSVRSATTGGEDVMTTGLEVTADRAVTDLALSLTDRAGELSGRLLDRLGRPAPEYFVFVFSVDRSAWHRHSPALKIPTRPGTDGQYRIGGLPAGEYYVVALTGVEDVDYLDPEFLEQIVPAAIRVKLADREKRVQDIQLSGGK